MKRIVVALCLLLALATTVSADGPSITDLVQKVNAGIITRSNFQNFISDSAKMVGYGSGATRYVYSTGAGGYSYTGANGWQMAVNESAPFLAEVTALGMRFKNMTGVFWAAGMAAWSYGQTYDQRGFRRQPTRD